MKLLILFSICFSAHAGMGENVTGPIGQASPAMTSLLNKIYEAEISGRNQSGPPSAKISDGSMEIKKLKKGARFSVIANQKVFGAKLKGVEVSENEEIGTEAIATLVLDERPPANPEGYKTSYLAVSELKIEPEQVGTIRKVQKVPKPVSDDLDKLLISKPENETREYFEIASRGGASYLIATTQFSLKGDSAEGGSHCHSSLWVRNGTSFKLVRSFAYDIEPISFTDLDRNGKWELLYGFRTMSREYGTDFSELDSNGFRKLKSVYFWAH